MKRNLFLLFFLLPFCLLHAQITITNAVFPVPGDTFSVQNVTNGTAGLDIGTAGPDQNWNFSFLGNGTTVLTIYKDPANAQNGALFPTATAFIEAGGNVETFFQKSTTSFASLGTIGSDFTGLGIGDAAVFNNPYILLRAPLSYNSGSSSTQTSITIRFSLNDLPDAIKDTILANVPLNIDSLGFGVSLSREDQVDAWGTLKIPGGSYEVLREKRTEVRAGRLEAKVPFLGWTDVTPYVQAIGGLGAIGNDTSVMYYFHNNVAKEPIALVSMDASGQSITSVQYKSGDGTVNTQDFRLDANAFRVSPNPVSQKANFSVDGLASGRYKLVILDRAGRTIKTSLFENTFSSVQVTMDMKDFSKGAYFAVVTDLQGNILGTIQVVKD